MENTPITIDYESIIRFSDQFIAHEKVNPFYGKSVFFSQGLVNQKEIAFQIVGNLGGWPTDTEFGPETDFFIVTKQLLLDLQDGVKHDQLTLLEKKLNSKGKKYTDLQIVSELAFLAKVQKRCEAIEDYVTLSLINRIL